MGRLVCALRVRSLGCRYVRLIEWLNGERNECNFELCSRERTQMHHLGPRHRDQHYILRLALGGCATSSAANYFVLHTSLLPGIVTVNSTQLQVAFSSERCIAKRCHISSNDSEMVAFIMQGHVAYNPNPGVHGCLIIHFGFKFSNRSHVVSLQGRHGGNICIEYRHICNST